MDAVSLAINIVDLSVKVVQYANDVKEAQDDKNRLKEEVLADTGIMLSLHKIWDDPKLDKERRQDLLPIFKPHGIADSYRSLLKKVSDDLQPKKQRILSNMKWPFKKGEIQKIFETLGRYKQSLQIAQQQLQVRDVWRFADDSLARLDQIHDDTNESRRILQTSELRNICSSISAFDLRAEAQSLLSSCKDSKPVWFLREPAFDSWRKLSGSPVLWVYGDPGTGKTVVASLVLDQMCARYDADAQCAVLGFFCNFQDTSVDADSIIRAFLRQLLEQLQRIPEKFIAACKAIQREMHEEDVKDDPSSSWELIGPTDISLPPGEDHDTDAMRSNNITDLFVNSIERLGPLAVLKILIDQFQTCFVVLDGLDEIDDGRRAKLIHDLKQLLSPPVRVIVFSRENLSHLIQKHFTDCAQFRISGRDHDVAEFVKSQVTFQACHFDRAFSMVADEERTVIENKIAQKSAGLFLLAQNYVKTLSDCPTPSDLHHELGSLSGGLEDVVDSTLGRIRNQPWSMRVLGERVLLWVIHTKRSLTVNEIQHALATYSDRTPGHLDENAVPGEATLVEAAQGLVTVDKASGELKIHKGFYDYLAEDSGRKIARNPETEIAKICIKYLSFDWLRRLTQAHHGQDLQHTSCLTLIMDPSEHVAGGHLCDGDGNNRIELREFPLRSVSCFLEYAARHLGAHVKAAVQKDLLSSMFALLQKDFNCLLAELVCVRAFKLQNVKKSSELEGTFSLKPVVSSGFNLIGYHGLKNVLERVWEHPGLNLAGPPDIALQYACLRGFPGVVRTLIAHGARVPFHHRISVNNDTCLHLAARRNHGEAMKPLLKALPKNPASTTWLNTQNKNGYTALYDAASRGHSGVVKLLLQAGASASLHCSNAGTAMHAAARGDHSDTVDALFSSAGRPILEEKTPAWQDTPLSICACRGRPAMMTKLLDLGADIDTRQRQGKTPLLLATECNRPRCARILLDRGASVTPGGDKGLTPLHEATQNAMPEVLECLVGREDGRRVIDHQDGEGRSALLRAVQLRRPRCFRALLRAGASLDVQTVEGETARTLVGEMPSDAFRDMVDELGR